MCGGFVEDVLDAVSDVVEDVGDFIGDTVEAVVENPIGAIVSVGGMALGIPPVYAGALGGAANAAANDGNILEGALTGGVMGYVGGAAGSAAAEAGAGATLSGAAGGAAAGAAGAALTGQDILQGALTGGALGGGAGYLTGGAPVSGSNTAPVYEYNPFTGTIDLVSDSTGLNILNNQQTADLMSNVDPNLINSFQDTNLTAGNQADTGTGEPYRVEVGGLPGTAENPGYSLPALMTPGSQLATFAQIDAGLATWNPAANAWEIGATPDLIGTPMETGGPAGPVNPTTYTFDDGSTFTFNNDGSTNFTDATGGGGSHGTSTVSGGGGTNPTTYTFEDGTWLSVNPDGSSVWTDTSGATHTSEGGTVTGPGTGGNPVNIDDVPELVITDTRPTTPVTPTTPVVPTTPVDTDVPEITITDTRPVTPEPPVVEPPVIEPPVVEPPVVEPPPPPEPPPEPPVVEPPVGPVFPVVPVTPQPPVTPPPTPPVTTTPTVLTPLKTDFGLNPGWIQPVAQYKTTSPVQSQYWWGAHPFQEGSTFNAELASHGIGAPATPWGLQQMYTQLTPEQTAALFKQPAYLQATMQQPVSGPIVPQ